MYRGGKNQLDPARIWGDDGLPDPGSTIARAGEAKSLSVVLTSLPRAGSNEFGSFQQVFG